MDARLRWAGVHKNGQRVVKITVNFDKHSRNKDGTETAENEIKMIDTWNDTKSDQLLQTNYAIINY